MHPASGGVAKRTHGPAGVPGSLQPAPGSSIHQLKGLPCKGRCGKGLGWQWPQRKDTYMHSAGPMEQTVTHRATQQTQARGSQLCREPSQLPTTPGWSWGNPRGPAPGRGLHRRQSVSPSRSSPRSPLSLQKPSSCCWMAEPSWVPHPRSEPRPARALRRSPLTLSQPHQPVQAFLQHEKNLLADEIKRGSCPCRVIPRLHTVEEQMNSSWHWGWTTVL